MEALKASLDREKPEKADERQAGKAGEGKPAGYAFKEWKGNFYPQDLEDDGMLGYCTRANFRRVEINNTFYRLPRENVLRDWAAQVPETSLSR